MENGAFAEINDFIISFEPPCYFTTLVGRIIKVFIPKAWIDHIAWGHDNTLVGGNVMCVNLHTFYKTKTGPKRPKTNPNMPNMLCFYVYMCAGTDIVEMDKNHGKTTTRARDLEKVEKAEAGEETMVKKSKSTLENPYLSRIVLGSYLGKMVEIALEVSTITHLVLVN